jgi:lipopolysaccharide/colanic/teichoic acid biosynthesis glycosyltransferase
MTGWAQINYGYGGSRGGTVEKLQYDFYYVKCQSLRLDLLILASTARAVFAGSGS